MPNKFDQSAHEEAARDRIFADAPPSIKPAWVFSGFRCQSCGWSMAADTERPVTSCRNQKCADYGVEYDLPVVKLRKAGA